MLSGREPGPALLLAAFLLAPPLACGFPPEVFDQRYHVLHEGDVNIGAILSMHTSRGDRCTHVTMGTGGVEFLESLLYAVRRVNQDAILDHVTLGVFVLDDCFSSSLALMRAVQFMPTAPAQPGLAVAAAETTNGCCVHCECLLELNSSRHHANISRDVGSCCCVECDDATAASSESPPRPAETTGQGGCGCNPCDVACVSRAVTPSCAAAATCRPRRCSKCSGEDAPCSRQLDSAADVAAELDERSDDVHQDYATSMGPDETDESLVTMATPNRLPSFFEVAGVVGAYTSHHSTIAARVLRLFRLPLVSPSATSDALSDKRRFPFFLRTLPPNQDQVQAMAALVRHFNWTYVSLVYSEDTYGHNSQTQLVQLLAVRGVCVAQTLPLGSEGGTGADYDNVIASLRRRAHARVVLLYANVKHVLPLVAAVRRNRAQREFTWIASDAASIFSDQNPQLCSALPGSFTVKAHAVTPPDFLAYLNNRIRQQANATTAAANNSNNNNNNTACTARSLESWPPSVWDSRDQNEVVDSQDEAVLTYAAFVIDAVYAFAHAIRALLHDKCPQARGAEARACVRQHPVHPYLKKVSFQGTSGLLEFDAAGDVMGVMDIRQCQERQGRAASHVIGTWDRRDSVLSLRDAFPGGRVPESVCGRPCEAGQIYAFTRLTCCWSCVSCKPNEVTSDNASTCLACHPFQWPDPLTRRHCSDIDIPDTPTHRVVALTLQVAAVVGLMVSAVTAFTFGLYRRQRVIRSSSRELSAVMLVGVASAFLLVFPLLATPSPSTCYVTHVGFGMTFTWVYAPLLVKTHRIFRIFRAGKQSAALPHCTSSCSQLGLVALLVSAQVVIVTVCTVVEPPSVELRQPVVTERYVERLCRLPLGGVVAALSYNVLLVAVCAVLAFRTRRLPDNYSESRYIAFCVDTTLLVWLTFVPAYFTASLAAHKVLVLALALLLHSAVHLACLFLPRLHALFRVMRGAPPGDTKRCTCSYGQIPLQRASAVEAGGSFTSDVAGSTNEVLVSGLTTRTTLGSRDGRYSSDSHHDPPGADGRTATSAPSGLPTARPLRPSGNHATGGGTARREICRQEFLNPAMTCGSQGSVSSTPVTWCQAGSSHLETARCGACHLDQVATLSDALTTFRLSGLVCDVTPSTADSSATGSCLERTPPAGQV